MVQGTVLRVADEDLVYFDQVSRVPHLTASDMQSSAVGVVKTVAESSPVYFSLWLGYRWNGIYAEMHWSLFLCSEPVLHVRYVRFVTSAGLGGHGMYCIVCGEHPP